MKSLSNIILEESIRISLMELDVKPIKPEDTTTTTTNTVTNTSKVDKDKAYNIAKQIIDSKGIFDDNEQSLVSAFKTIPDMSTFYAVNTLIKNTKQRTISDYIASFVDNDEFTVWNPILNHLLKIKAPDNILKRYLTKTRWSYISKDKQLASKLADKGLVSGIQTTDKDIAKWAWSNPNTLLFFGILAGLGIVKSKSLRKFISGLISSNSAVKQAMDQPKIANFYSIRRLIGSPKAWNKKRMEELLKYEYNKGRLTRAEYAECISTLYNLKRSDINKVYFDLVLKAMKRRDPAAIKPGNVQRIITMIDDEQFTEKLGPKLQAIEDDILGKQSKKNVVTTTKPIISTDLQKLKDAGFSTVKPNLKSFDMSRWISIQGKLGNGISLNDKFVLDKIGKQFIKELPISTSSSDAATKSIFKITGEDNLESAFNGHPGIEQWYNWIMKTKSGTRRYKYYDSLEEFPSYKQWSIDMKKLGVKNISTEYYDIAYYNWLNFTTP